MPLHSLDRSSYYRMYYNLKKDQIRNRYFEKKCLNLIEGNGITLLPYTIR